MKIMKLSAMKTFTKEMFRMTLTMNYILFCLMKLKISHALHLNIKPLNKSKYFDSFGFNQQKVNTNNHQIYFGHDLALINEL